MRILVAIGLSMLAANSAWALDAAGQRYIEQMTQGSMHSVKSAAQSMYNTRESNTEVLDVAAEVLLKNYANSPDSDTMAWLAKALGRSHNGRYYNVLKEVADGGSDKRLRKHANSALKELGGPSGEQYTRGMANLDKAAKGKPSKPAPAAASAPRPSAGGRSAATFSDIRKGMSMPEVYDLLGPPTSTTSHMTGKAFIPFNYRGADLVRSYALYKGQGRIVFSTSSRYDRTMRVIEILPNPEEKGYP